MAPKSQTRWAGKEKPVSQREAKGSAGRPPVSAGSTSSGGGGGQVLSSQLPAQWKDSVRLAHRVTTASIDDGHPFVAAYTLACRIDTVRALALGAGSDQSAATLASRGRSLHERYQRLLHQAWLAAGSSDGMGAVAPPAAVPAATPGGTAKAQLAPLKAMHTVTDVRNAFDQHAAQVLHQVAPKLTATVLKVIGQQQRTDDNGTDDGAASASSQSSPVASQWQLDVDRLSGIARAGALAFGGTIVQWWHSANMARIFKQSLNTSVSCTSSGPPIHAPLCAVLGWGCHTFTVTTIAPLAPLVPPTTEEATARPGAIWAASLAVTQQQRRSQFVAEASEALFTSNGAVMNTKMSPHTHLELGVDGRVYVIDVVNSFVGRLVGKAPAANVAARVKSLAEALDKNAGQMLAGAGVAPSALTSESSMSGGTRASNPGPKGSRETTPSQRFVHEAHSHGVALRHLGDVYTATSSDAARTILVSEMTARVCRDLYWARLVVTAGATAAAAQHDGQVDASGADDAKATFADVVKALAASDGAFLKHVVFPLLPGKFNLQGKVAVAYVNLSMTLKRLAAKVGVQEAFVAMVIAEAKRSSSASKGGSPPPTAASSEFAVRVVRRGGRAGAHAGSTKAPMPIQLALPGATSADDPGVVGILGPKASPALLPGHADNAKLSPVSRFLHGTVRAPVQSGTIDVASVFGATSDTAKKLTDAHRRLALEAATAQQQPGAAPATGPAPPAVKELAQALDLVSLAAFALRAAFAPTGGRGCAHGLVAAAGDLLAECKTVMAKLPAGQTADDTPEPIARLRAAVYGTLMHHVMPTLGGIFDRLLSSATTTPAVDEAWCCSEQKTDIVTHAAANAAALAAVIHGGAKVSEALGAAQQLARVQCVVSAGSLPVARPTAPPATGVQDYVSALREAEAAAVAELTRRASAKKEDGQQGVKSASIAPLLGSLAAFRQAVASVKKNRRTALLDPATLQVIGSSDAGACTIRTALLELRALACPLQLYAQTPLRLRNHVALSLAEGTCQRVAAYVLPKFTRLIAADSSTAPAEHADSTTKQAPAPRTALARAATGAAIAAYCELAVALIFGRRFDEAAQYVESGLSVAREYSGPTLGLLRLQARIARCQDSAPEVQIQREWRRFSEEKLAARKREEAAAVMQRLGRACVERRELRGLAALCRIQRAGRAFVTRRDDVHRDLVVKPLQRVARGFQIRHSTGITHARRTAGAAVVGRVARAFVKRRALGVWRRLTADGSTLIQRLARGAQERSRVRRLHCAATFQRIGRAFLQGRDRLGMLRGVLLHNCTKLQRLSRGLAARRRLGREYGRNREADVVTGGRLLQRIGRGLQSRRLLQSRVGVVRRAKATALLNRIFAAYSVRTMITTAQGHLRYLATLRLQRVGAAYAFGRHPLAMQRRLRRANACIPVQGALRAHLAARRANELAADEIHRLEALELVQRVMRGATTRACVETVRRWSGASAPASPRAQSRPPTAANTDVSSARSATDDEEEEEEDDGRLFMAAHVVERVLGDSLARQMASQCVARVVIGGAGRHAVFSRMRIMGEAARLLQAAGRAMVVRRALSAVPAARRLIVRCFGGYQVRTRLATDQRMACRLQRVGRAMAKRRRLAAYGVEERARLARMRVRRDNVLRACDGIDALLERRKEVTRSIVDTAASHDDIARDHRRAAFVERKSPALTRMALLRRPLGPLPHVVDGTTADGHKWSVTRYSLARDIRQRDGADRHDAASMEERRRKLPPLPELAERDGSMLAQSSTPPVSSGPSTPPPRASGAVSRSSAALAKLDGAGMPDQRAGSSLVFRRRALGRILGAKNTPDDDDDETLTPTPHDVAEIDSYAARRRNVHPLHERGPGPAVAPRGASCPPIAARSRPSQLQPLAWIDRRPARLPVEATPEPGTPTLRAL